MASIRVTIWWMASMIFFGVSVGAGLASRYQEWGVVLKTGALGLALLLFLIHAVLGMGTS